MASLLEHYDEFEAVMGKSKDRKSQDKDKNKKNNKKEKGKKNDGKHKKRGPKRSRYTAATADRYELYQLSVQSAPEDVEFLSGVYRELRGRDAHHFREDFCGTALLSATWALRGDAYTAEGYDIDPEPLAWGQTRNIEPLGPVADRVQLFQKDAREPSARPPDVRCAQNFSYWVFKRRNELLDYFRKAHADLNEDGIFVIDLHGGPEAMQEMEESSKIDEGFTYVWDQDKFWPVTGECEMHIHFRFRDGTRLKRAFTYHWRMWGLPELREILEDAGFAQVDCYWEGTDEDGESGNGIFTRDERGEYCLAYVAYLVARK